jgi:hypothetical protein
LAEQVAKLSKTGRLDAESIADVKTRIVSYPSTALPVKEKVAEAASPVPRPSPPLVVFVYGILTPYHHQRTMIKREDQACLPDTNSTMLQNTLRSTGQSLN